MKLTIKSSLTIAVVFFAMIFNNIKIYAQDFSHNNSSAVREHLLMDFGWKFALGNACDAKKDFDNGTGYFSYFAKTGYGDGAAAKDFDDRAWSRIDLPHDWCVELPFDPRGSHSHG